jgi:hypothetical protein
MTAMSGSAAMNDVEHQSGHFRQEDTNALQGIAFRAGEYVTRRVGPTEPIDLNDGPHGDTDLSGTAADISPGATHRSQARGQKLDRDRSGLARDRKY